MAYNYSTPSRGASIRLTPSRMPLATAARLGLPWNAAVDALRANVIAVREHLVANDYPTVEPLSDDLALEVIDSVGRLDRHDRYLLRLLFGMLYRGAISKSRNGHDGPGDADSKARQATTTAAPLSSWANSAPPNSPFARTARYGNGDNNQ